LKTTNKNPKLGMLFSVDIYPYVGYLVRAIE